MTDLSAGPPHRLLWCDHALVDTAIRSNVLVGIDQTGRIHSVEVDAHPSSREGATQLPGVTLPGLVNAHSHAFHRVLRGRTHDGTRSDERAGAPDVAVNPSSAATFWSWREQMYRVAEVLDPDLYHRLARAVFAEMALAGITCVGEFHYLHHDPDGKPYSDPNAMGEAVIAAAAEAGLRVTLLDTIYLTGEVGATIADPALSPVQLRFSDGDHAGWERRVGLLSAGTNHRIGAAIHSVRAVPPGPMQVVAELTADGSHLRVLHAHVSEQPRENEQARERLGRSPTELLADAGAITDAFTAVHGVWLDNTDRRLLGDVGATVCACPTTERELADGIVAGGRLAGDGVRLALGSDSHAVIDLFEEARGLELDQRLATLERGHHDPIDLLAAATTGGARSLGWPEVGRIEPGAFADLAVVGLDSVRLAGTRHQDLAASIVFAATAADVTHTIVAGRDIVVNGHHADVDVTAELATAIAAVDTAMAETTR